MKPNLSNLDTEISFERFGGGQARLISIAHDDITEQDMKTIVAICNQPEVKKWVTFQYATGEDGIYTLDDAYKFIDSSKQEWHAGTRSSFLIRNESNKIVGTIGIKLPEEYTAEVGYWSDTQGPKGYMTNALNSLVSLVRKIGFNELYAVVMPENTASQNLLVRAGFVEQGLHVKQDGRELIKFIKSLDSKK